MTTEPSYDGRFASYATRVAFDIRLTRQQIFYLCYAASYSETDYETRRNAEVSHVGRSLFVPFVKGLIERGLVEHNPRARTETAARLPYIYRLTPAGEHVMALLKIAGLAVAFSSAANDAKPQKRKARA